MAASAKRNLPITVWLSIIIVVSIATLWADRLDAQRYQIFSNSTIHFASKKYKDPQASRVRRKKSTNFTYHHAKLSTATPLELKVGLTAQPLSTSQTNAFAGIATKALGSVIADCNTSRVYEVVLPDTSIIYTQNAVVFVMGPTLERGGKQFAAGKYCLVRIPSHMLSKIQ